MFKRILKVLGICLAIVVVVSGLGVGFFALRGGFDTVVIDIVKLYANDATVASQEVYTLVDIPVTINCDPFDATDKVLDVIVQDPLRVVDKDGNLVKEGILKNVPKTVVAGKEFMIELNKDSMGNNIGGVATLTFRPANSDKVITDFKLKVVVDVVIPNNSLYFAGNNSDDIDTSGKTITMGLNTQPQNIYLKSNLINAFCLETSKGNLKQAEISYVYKNQKNEVIEEKTFSNLNYQPNFNEETQEYNYYYEIPLTPKTPGTIEVIAKMHKTNEIESAYNVGEFYKLENLIITSNEAIQMLQKYNAFLDKYIQYFDTNDESYKFFGQYFENGKLNIPFAKVAESKKYIFETCKTTIKVTAVNLNDITSLETPKEFKVHTSRVFSLSDLINEFELEVSLDKSDVANLESEIDNLYGTLAVRPYIYIEKEDYYKSGEELWSDYSQVYGVTSFVNGQPSGVKSLTSDEIQNFNEGVGFLLYLDRNYPDEYKDYMTVDLKPNRMWEIGFNVPLQSDSIASLTDIKKALFLEFEVTGLNLQTNEKIVKNTYTRIFINYTDYQFQDADNAKISFDCNDIKKMTINSRVENAEGKGYANGLNEQVVDLKLASTITNYNSVEYKSVMYFVESTSNKLESGGSKVATIGRYNFKYMSTTASENGFVNLFGTDKLLEGERLPFRGTKDDPTYYIHAINASAEPVKIFAVVYLSDEKGNPINVNGKPIIINESDDAPENNTLVVFAITDVTETGMQEVYIDSFVEHINFYTNNVLDKTIEETVNTGTESLTGTFNVTGNFVKRNIINGYTNGGVEFSTDKLNEINDLLKLKLLYNNEFTLYATAFELNSSGSTSSEEGYDAPKTMYLNIKDFKGNVVERPFEVDTLQNKQLAFNKMCNDFNNEFTLNIASTNDSIRAISIEGEKDDVGAIKRDENGNIIRADYIKFSIVAEGKNTSSANDYIYIRAKNGVINALSEDENENKVTSFVSWQVSSAKVLDVALKNYYDDIKLYALHNQSYNPANPTQNVSFATLGIASNSYDTLKYALYGDPSHDSLRETHNTNLLVGIESGILANSLEDNLPYTIYNNLVDAEETSLNLDLVDMSQATYSSSEEGSFATAYGYTSIQEYLNRYIYNTNSLEISYLNAGGYYQLEQDLIFKVNNKNKLQVGIKTFEVNEKDDLTGGKFVVINGKTFDLDGYNQLVISAGQYFPVANYTDGGKPIIIILGEEFTVYENNGVKYINNIPETTEYQLQAVVTDITSKLNPHDYIYDGTNDSSAVKSALTKVVDGDGVVNSASINFIKGGLSVDKYGKQIFVQDKNGNYKKVGNEYVFCSAGEEGDRYSKKGIEVYLMITFDGTSFEKPFTKTIKYELVQEDIELQAVDAIDNTVVTLTSDNQSIGRISINAGDTTTFYLIQGPISSLNNKNQISLSNTNIDDNFFNHCEYELRGNGIKFANNNSKIIELGSAVGDLKIQADDRYSSGSATLIVRYYHQGVLEEKQVIINIKSNISFGIKPSASQNVDTSNDEYYIIELDDNEEYLLSDLISTYFSIDENYTCSLTKTTSEANKYVSFAGASISGNQLIIGRSYATIDPNSTTGNIQLIRDHIYFDIKLTSKTDAGKTITITRKLRIDLNPTYTLDLRNLDNNLDNDLDNDIKILNGESLISSTDYIKVYNGSIIHEDYLISNTQYGSIFNITLGGVECTNGIINIDSGSAGKEVDLVLVYGENSFEFKVYVYNYEIYFSDRGEFPILGSGEHVYDQYDTSFINGKTKLSSANSTLTIELATGQTINLDNYFAVFCEGNVIKKDLYMIVTDSNLHEISEAKTYTLAVGIMINGQYVKLYELPYNLNVVNASE